MKKYKLSNGWTKEKIMEQIKKYNNGTKSLRKSSGGTLFCSYQTEDGNRCAIGAFIPDNHPGLKEILGVYSLLESHPNLKKYMPFNDEEALARLQMSHDSNHDVYKSIENFLLEYVE